MKDRGKGKVEKEESTEVRADKKEAKRNKKKRKKKKTAK